MKMARWMIDHNFKWLINTIFNHLAKMDEMIRWGLEQASDQRNTK